jgi:hypothetical protein
LIGITFGELAEEDQRRIEEEMLHEMEEIEATRMKEKLMCYQKTRGGVVQNTDTAKASSPKVNSSSLSSEDLVHLVDISIPSKYGANLAHFTQVLAEDLHGTLDYFKHDLNDNLPR